LANNLGVNIDSLPLTYLGVPIFEGGPKYVYFQPIADKIKNKLVAWKASLLSIAGRVLLIKSVIQGMLIHCITIYSWPVKLLKDFEKWMRNFIWIGDINQGKLVTIAWNQVCRPLEEGGLGVRNLSFINEACNLKVCWDIMQSYLQWAQFIRSKILRNKKPVNNHVSSSIWSGVRHKILYCAKKMCMGILEMGKILTSGLISGVESL